jgi:hypothetical protein
MLGIDNSLLSECQKAADTAMIRVCGSIDECNQLAVDEGIGSRSLEYKFCEFKPDGNSLSIAFNSCRPTLDNFSDTDLAGPVVNNRRTGGLNIAATLIGTVYWENITFNDDGSLTSVEDYLKKLNESDMTDELKQLMKDRVGPELASLQRSIDSAIQAIESDAKVQFCITGRQVQGMGNRTALGNTRNSLTHKEGGEEVSSARFPALTKQMRIIIASYAIKAAKANYYAKFDELNNRMLEDYVKASERLAKIMGEDSKNVRREFARRACLSLPSGSILPKSPQPPKNALGTIVKAVAIAGAIVALPIAGPAVAAASGLAFTTGIAGISAAALTTGAGMAVVGAAGAGLVSTIARAGGGGGGTDSGTDLNSGFGVCDNPDVEAGLNGGLTASQDLNQWNFKEVITTTFACETLICHKCTKSQQCDKTKNPLFGNKYCGSWGEEKEVCIDTQF